jgi:hypothetical protein
MGALAEDIELIAILGGLGIAAAVALYYFWFKGSLFDPATLFGWLDDIKNIDLKTTFEAPFKAETYSTLHTQVADIAGSIAVGEWDNPLRTKYGETKGFFGNTITYADPHLQYGDWRDYYAPANPDTEYTYNPLTKQYELNTFSMFILDNQKNIYVDNPNYIQPQYVYDPKLGITVPNPLWDGNPNAPTTAFQPAYKL